jgi:ferredoxin
LCVLCELCDFVVVQMAKRKIIKIDESRCTGCGECITACAEAAIELKGGKARVVSDSFCDGLGACLAVCPAGALTIEEREAEEFDEAAVKQYRHQKEIAVSPCTAPVSLKPRDLQAAEVSKSETETAEAEKKGTVTSQLSSWPIQMRLVRLGAPYLKGARLLVAGDCTAFAYPRIQQNFIKGRVALVGCPKLDEKEPFVTRLSEILMANDIRDITVLHMTVPCCAQLNRLVAEAIKRSGKDIPVKAYIVGIEGSLKES